MFILIYANCQGNSIRYFLQKKLKPCVEIKFIKNYIENVGDDSTVPEEDLKRADIFIFQFKRPYYGTTSTDSIVPNNILKRLKPECKLYGFPCIYMSALWPLWEGDRITDGQEIILSLKKDHSLEEILQMYDKGNIDWRFLERVQKCINYTREHENHYIKNDISNCTIIPISDFIEKNYQRYNLFFDHCHPTAYVYAFLVNHILKDLKIEPYKIFEQPETMAFLPKYLPPGYSSQGYLYHTIYEGKELNLAWLTVELCQGDERIKQIVSKVYKYSTSIEKLKTMKEIL